jgi:hypothetical protein
MMTGENRRRTLRRWLLAGLSLLLISFGLYAWQLLSLTRGLKGSLDELQRIAFSDPARMDLAQMESLLDRSHEQARQLRSWMKPLTTISDHLGWMPSIGPTLASGGPLLDYAVGLTGAGQELLSSFTPLWQEDETQMSGLPMGEKLYRTLKSAELQLHAAQAALDQALAARGRFDPAALPDALGKPLEKVDPLLPIAARGVSLLPALPELLGDSSPQTYLLLAQNEHELRATGGFISGVGTLTLEQGAILQWDIDDSYAVDNPSVVYPPPPEPIQDYMLGGQWMMRDANWSPDFPTSAAKAVELYRLSTGKDVRGVIAFNQAALTRLLAVIGPVRLTDYPEPISSHNLLDYMLQARGTVPTDGVTPEWWRHRKDFMRLLGAAMLERVQTASDRHTIISLVQAVFELMEQKHLLIWVQDEQIMGLLPEFGLGGSLKPGPGDALLVIDTNMGFNKVDSMVERRWHYRVDLRDPHASRAELLLTYANTVQADVPCMHEATYGNGSYGDMQRRCYWDFVRVYAAPGASLTSGQLPPTPADWLLRGEPDAGIWSQDSGAAGMTVFSGFFVLPTSEQATLKLSYRLPDGILTDGEKDGMAYHLRLIKQSGTEGVPIQVQVQAPLGFSVIHNTLWETSSNGTALWRGRLTTDIDLTLEFQAEDHQPGKAK